MTKKETLSKALIWRLLIAIPVTLIINYLFLGNLSSSFTLTIVGNFVGTILYYLYDLTWFKYEPYKKLSLLSAGKSPPFND